MTGGPAGALPNAHDHAPWADDAAAYALGALDADERAAFEAHLAGCARCAAEVRQFRDVGVLLAREAGAESPSQSPSPSLRARILSEARANPSPATTAPATTAPATTAPATTAPDAPATAAQPLRPRTATSSIRAITPARRPTAWAPWYAAAACLALAAGLGAGWARERQVRLAERERALGTLQELAARVRRRGALVDRARDSLLAVVTAPDARTARLAVPGEPAAARLIWSPGQGAVLLTASAMPRPHAGRTYQLWGIAKGGQPQSLGTFTPEENGRVQVVLHVPPEAEMQVAAVTEEPDGGSPRPTGQPLMTGQIEGA